MVWINKLVEAYPDLQGCSSDIQRAAELLGDCFDAGGKLLVCGNGGSAADAEHIVGELMKGYRLARKIHAESRKNLIAAFPQEGSYLADHLQGALPAISLVSQSALLSAFANDVAPDMVYAQQVFGYGRAGDVLWAISTSGNAANVMNAARVALSVGLRVIGLTGPDGGQLKALSDVCICAPGKNTPEVQERHLPIYHAICAALEDRFFGR